MLFKKFAVVAAIATTLAFVGCSKKEEAATDANAAASEAVAAASEAVEAVEVAASDVAASAAQ